MPTAARDDDLQPGGPVERWLDAVFDGLTGTGREGRRALLEIEDHLRAAVADGRAHGLDPHAAEREAVTRFGSPDRIARDIGAVHRDLVRRALTTVWLLGGAVTLAIGLSIVVTAGLRLALDGGLTVFPCVDIMADDAGLSCAVIGGGRDLAYEGLAVVGAGLFGLLALAAARRLTPMRSDRWVPRRQTVAVAAGLFAVAGLVGLAAPATPVPHYNTRSDLIPVASAVVIIALVMVVSHWTGRLRRRRDWLESVTETPG